MLCLPCTSFSLVQSAEFDPQVEGTLELWWIRGLFTGLTVRVQFPCPVNDRFPILILLILTTARTLNKDGRRTGLRGEGVMDSTWIGWFLSVVVPNYR